MRIFVVAALIGTALVAVPMSQTRNSRTSDSLERAFPANGRIKMDLSAGEYRIEGSQENRIRLQWNVGDADLLPEVTARADVRGSEATITLDGPDRRGPGRDFEVAVTLPARSDLFVRLTAGKLTIEGIEGNKDIASHAGEINIDVGRAEDYRLVEGSVWAGEIHAVPYRMSKEGLFRSLEWNGKGPYRLQAALKAGEINLYSKSTPRP